MIKFTQFFKQKIAALKKLPAKVIALYTDERKKDAELIAKNFKQGILKNSLGLASLKRKTVIRKERKGFSFPSNPLVGKGDQSKNSYANMMQVTKIDNGYGYKVSPKTGMHWSGDISLKKLFLIHEDSQKASLPKRPALQIVLKQTPVKSRKVSIDSKFIVRIKK